MAISGFLFLTISQQTPDHIILGSGRRDLVGALFLHPFKALQDRASFRYLRLPRRPPRPRRAPAFLDLQR